jgi:hypothetical protein
MDRRLLHSRQPVVRQSDILLLERVLGEQFLPGINLYKLHIHGWIRVVIPVSEENQDIRGKARRLRIARDKSIRAEVRMRGIGVTESPNHKISGENIPNPPKMGLRVGVTGN